MKRLLILVFIAGGISAVSAQPAHAAPLRISAAAYPPGAHISSRALSNADMDCIWGFFCEGGVPLFHLQTQDQLNRQSGWAQFGGIRHHGVMSMSFELFASQYSDTPDGTGTPWSEQAFVDLNFAILTRGYRPDQRDASLLPAGPGHTLVAIQRLGKTDLVVMALWSGTTEIEGIAQYDHRNPSARQTAWSCLALQIGLAAAGGV